MKIKNLKISEHIEQIIGLSLIIGISAAGIRYYNYEKIEQVQEIDLDKDHFIKENDNISYLFAPGEHSIKISRNSCFSDTFEQIDGYEIVKVETNGKLSNCQVTYVNDEPVIVKPTSFKDGKYEFETFGKVTKEKEVQKVK